MFSRSNRKQQKQAEQAKRDEHDLKEARWQESLKTVFGFLDLSGDKTVAHERLSMCVKRRFGTDDGFVWLILVRSKSCVNCRERLPNSFSIMVTSNLTWQKVLAEVRKYDGFYCLRCREVRRLPEYQKILTELEEREARIAAIFAEDGETDPPTFGRYDGILEHAKVEYLHRDFWLPLWIPQDRQPESMLRLSRLARKLGVRVEGENGFLLLGGVFVLASVPDGGRRSTTQLREIIERAQGYQEEMQQAPASAT